MNSKQNIPVNTHQCNELIGYSLRRNNEPIPRCLAALPKNIEELLHQFKRQGNGLCTDSRPYFHPEEMSKNSIDQG